MTKKLTLPIAIGRRYVRRDGKVVTAQVFAEDPQRVWVEAVVSIANGQCAGSADYDLIADAPEDPKTYAITDYADILRAIADGKEVEIQNYEGTGWVEFSTRDVLGLISHGGTQPGFFRIKPDTITINGREVPAPTRTAPRARSAYWLPDLFSPERARLRAWADIELEFNLLHGGLVHLTEEAARAHAEALLSFTRREG